MTLQEARLRLWEIDIRELYHVAERVPDFLRLRSGIDICSAVVPPHHKIPKKLQDEVERFYKQAKGCRACGAIQGGEIK